MLAGADPALDTTNIEDDSEMEQESEDRTLHRMAKVHDTLEMWQGSQILCATQNEFRAEYEQMTAVG